MIWRKKLKNTQWADHFHSLSMCVSPSKPHRLVLPHPAGHWFNCISLSINLRHKQPMGRAQESSTHHATGGTIRLRFRLNRTRRENVRRRFTAWATPQMFGRSRLIKQRQLFVHSQSRCDGPPLPGRSASLQSCDWLFLVGLLSFIALHLSVHSCAAHTGDVTDYLSSLSFVLRNL